MSSGSQGLFTCSFSLSVVITNSYLKLILYENIITCTGRSTNVHVNKYWYETYYIVEINLVYFTFDSSLADLNLSQ